MSRRAVSRRAVSRRAFVLGVGVGAGLAVGGCSVTADPARLAASAYTGDFRTVALAAALENQAVSTYMALQAVGRHAQGGWDSAGSGRWGPAFTKLVDTCASQHAEHAVTWNAILRAARKPAVVGVPLVGRYSLLDAARSAKSIGDAIAIVLRLEVQAAETYMVAAGSLSSPAGVVAAAAIAPVEAMHATILRFMADEYPVPAAFLGTANAARTSELLRGL